MSSLTTRLMIAWIAVCCSLPLFGEADIRYRDRGDRWEGVKTPPVGAYPMELLSALIDHEQSPTGMPDRIRIRFYLARKSKPYVTVRELDCREYYWLDRIRPSDDWRAGSWNEFSWPTGDVIQYLASLKDLSALGAVARLDAPEPSQEETVSPVALCGSVCPKRVSGYTFAFKSSTSSRLSCRIYREGDAEPLFLCSFPRVTGGIPFTVKWGPAGPSEGWHRLVIRGYALNTGVPVIKVVRFYHRPRIE